tara:strand:+ start:190 stop:417 length:228 start_codon:yes stop_codon:yes gene_type:complete
MSDIELHKLDEYDNYINSPRYHLGFERGYNGQSCVFTDNSRYRQGHRDGIAARWRLRQGIKDVVFMYKGGTICLV